MLAFIHSFIRSFSHPYILPFIPSFNRSFIYSVIDSLPFFTPSPLSLHSLLDTFVTYNDLDLVAYVSYTGYFSWRNNVDGSWFIQALVRVFREHGTTMELTHLLTLVNKVVAYDFESCTDDDFTTGMKQVPCVVSTLTKLLYFEPKY